MLSTHSRVPSVFNGLLGGSVATPLSFIRSFFQRLQPCRQLACFLPSRRTLLSGPAARTTDPLTGLHLHRIDTSLPAVRQCADDTTGTCSRS
jgi:hypothetical protein